VQSIARRNEPPVPAFVQHVEAALLICGYRHGPPFERHFDDDEEYRAALANTSAELSDAAFDLAF
jgi:hypothetical protein